MGYSAKQRKVKVGVEGADKLAKDLQAMTVQVDYDRSLTYGTHVELGARGRPANPFLRNAVDDNQTQINEAIVAEISRAVGRTI